MNAYELADEAYKKATTRFDYDVALTMKQLIQQNSQQADRIAELEKAKTLTPELDSLLCSVNGDAYLGKTIEQKLVAVVRKQYSRPKNITEEEVRDIYRKLFGSEMSYQTAIFSKRLIRMARQNEL